MRPSNFVAGGWLCVGSPAAISDVIKYQTAAGCAHRTAPHRAALAGELRLAELLAGGTIPAFLLAPHETRPTLVIVCDDPAPVAPSLGPAGFPQARRLARWAGAVLLHAASGEATHYALATKWTRTVRRVLLIETCGGHEVQWRALLDAEAKRRVRTRRPALRGLTITAPRGETHAACGA